MTITIERGQDGPRSRPREPACPQEELIGLQMLALIPLRPFPLPGPVSLSRLKNKQTNNNMVNNKHRRGSSKKHGGGRGGGRAESRRTALARSYLRATAASHCSQGGRARSFTELHEASAQQQRGLEPGGRGTGGRRTVPGALPACTHCAAARSRRRSPERRCPDGQPELSVPLNMLLSVLPPVTEPSGD